MFQTLQAVCTACGRIGHEADEDSQDCFYRVSDDTCPDCCGVMNWCNSCKMWSQVCCVDWGTCACS